MQVRSTVLALLALSLTAASGAFAQAPRTDVIWARKAVGTITLDGVLDEPAWSAAESMELRYGVDAGIPGSGWKVESGAFVPPDTMVATLRFLVVGNQLYLGATVVDSSVGGSLEFNRFDGLLMALKDHADPGAPKPPAEYFYAWWYAEGTDPQPPGQSPAFIGKWAPWPPGTTRTATDIANWDATTVVHGLSNDDATTDTGYTVEMRFNLTPMGYDVTQAGGDVVEWNISIYDCDWFWPFDGSKFATNRVWWQSPWGNTAWYNEVQIHARPDVTTSSGALPSVGPEFTITELDEPAPVIDGDIDDAAWSNPNVYEFDIRWDDDALRATYPGVGPHRAGQFQPEVNGGTAFLLDPGDATVKVTFRDDMLYLGFDVRDFVVQYHPVFDRWDGFIVSLNDRAVRDNDNQLQGYRMTFQVGPTGAALPQEDLAAFVTAGDAEVAISLNAGTTVDTLGQQADAGYTAELAIDLTSIGYPPGLGDGSFFIGVNHLDGDSFIPAVDSYGTRTWWYREYETECCPAWVFLDRGVTAVSPTAEVASRGYARVVGNPSAHPRILYSWPEASRVELEVFDVTGRLVERQDLGLVGGGLSETRIDRAGKSSGVYFYRLRLLDPGSGALRGTLEGKSVLLN